VYTHQRHNRKLAVPPRGTSLPRTQTPSRSAMLFLPSVNPSGAIWNLESVIWNSPCLPPLPPHKNKHTRTCGRCGWSLAPQRHTCGAQAVDMRCEAVNMRMMRRNPHHNTAHHNSQNSASNHRDASRTHSHNNFHKTPIRRNPSRMCRNPSRMCREVSWTCRNLSANVADPSQPPKPQKAAPFQHLQSAFPTFGNPPAPKLAFGGESAIDPSRL
jgi:hypothetical protein